MSNENVIISCIDGSTVSDAVCDYSSWVANKVGAPLKLLHSIEHQYEPIVNDYSGAIGLGSREDLLNELTTIEQDRSRLLIEKGQILLKSARARANDFGVAEVELCQRHGNLVESLIELEARTRLVVLGIYGEDHEGLEKAVSPRLESIIRALHRPILVVNKSFSPPQKVLLAYDGSPACKKAVDMITNSPAFKDLLCHVVHVGEKDAQHLLDEASSALEAAGIQTKTLQLSGKIDDVLSEYQGAEEIDLMIMGAFSHTRVRDFLWGSFTAKMISKTRKPLLLLR